MLFISGFIWCRTVTTDWYAIRFADSGVEIPAGVKQARQEARDEIDTLRAELEALAAAKA